MIETLSPTNEINHKSIYRYLYFMSKNDISSQGLVLNHYDSITNTSNEIANHPSQETKELQLMMLRNACVSAGLFEISALYSMDVCHLNEEHLHNSAPINDKRQIIFMLPLPIREPLLLNILFGFNHKQISMITGVNEKVTFNRLFFSKSIFVKNYNLK
jgi:hypothetical protein